MSFKPDIPETPLYKSKPMISMHYKKDSEVKIGNTFDNKEVLDLAIRLKAIQESYQFLSQRIDPNRYERKCYHFKECAWSIHAKRWGNTDMFQIIRMNDVHTCPKTQTYPNHQNANKKVTAHILTPKLQDNKRVLKGKDIQHDILFEYKTSISYQQAWRGKDYGLNQIRGSPYESFEMLPYYCYNLERKNQGPVTRIKTDDKGVFEMLFISLGASIHTFLNYLRLFLIIDAAYLKGTYKGTNLVAVGMDGNNQIVSVAFGICKGETSPCWSWWMSVLKECIGDHNNLLFISNRHPAIALAVHNEFSLAFHVVCCRHLMMNLSLKNKQTKGLFWKICKTYTPDEFTTNMNRMKVVQPDAYHKLCQAGTQRWSRAHCLLVCYNYMTSNSVESVNACSVINRKLPVLKLAETYRAMLQEWFTALPGRRFVNGMVATLDPVELESLSTNQMKLVLTNCLGYDENSTTFLYIKKPGALSLYVGDGHRAAVEAIRTYHLELPGGLVIVLNNCHYAPSITRGVISVSRLFDDGFINRFDDNNVILVLKNNLVYFMAVLRDGIFEIDMSCSNTYNSSIYAITNKRAKINLDFSLLWHCRLGHIRKKRIEKLQHDGLLNSIDIESLGKCVSCMSGKMARKPNSHQVERAKDLLGLIHTDVFQKEVENQLGKTIKSLHSDRRGEYISQEFLGHLKEHGIISYRTPPYTPHNNGVSERRNRTLLDLVRSMMSQTTLPKSFWDYAVETTARILNMVPTKKRDTLTKLDKLDPRSFKCIFVGYLKETMGYSFYNLFENKVFVAQNAKFFEYKLLDLKASGSMEDLELIQEEDTNPFVDTSLNHEEDDQEIDEPRRDLGEPANYKAALLDPESKKWLEAMNVEMQSIKHNDVWVLVELPPNARTIGSKWLFTEKTDMDDIIAIRILIAIAAYYDYEIWQIDVKTVFLKGHLSKEVYMELPEGFINLKYPNHNPGDEHWTAVKNILKYLRNTKDIFLLYGDNMERELRVSCYTYAGYLTDADNLKSQNGYVFILNGAFDASKEAVWIRKFISGLGIVPTIEKPISMYCDNNGSIAIAKDDGVTKCARHFRVKVHYFRETIKLGDMTISVGNNSVFRRSFKKKLTGPNFIDWYRQLHLVLSTEDKENYLEHPIPAAPVAPHGQQELLQTMKEFHTSKQEEGQSISSHVLKMKGYIDNLELLGQPVGQNLATVNELHVMLKLHEETPPKKDANPALHAIQAGRVQKNQKYKPHKAAKEVMVKVKARWAMLLTMHHLILNLRLIHHLRKITLQRTPFATNVGKLGTKEGTGLQGIKKLKPGALSLYVGDGHRAAIEATRTYHLELPGGLVIVLNNCHYAPSITRGVILVLRLFDDGFINRFDDNNVILVLKNNLVYFMAVPRDGIFEIDVSCSNTNDSFIYAITKKRAKINLDSSILWHCRLGHISKKCIEKLQHDRLLNSIDTESLGKCVSCMSGKMARKPNSHQVEMAKDLLGQIHTDVCGSFKIMSRQGASYLVTFTNDFSRYVYVYLLKHKHELFETFKVFQKEVENQLGKTIKLLRSDRRGEYTSQEFLGHLKEHGIIAYHTPPYTPQNNGMSERMNQTLLDMVDKTPYEIWHGKAPKVSYLIVWGCEAFVKRDTLTKPDKLDPRSFKYLKASGSVEDLEQIQEKDTNPYVHISLNHEEDDQEIDEPQSNINPIRKSSKTHRAPDRMWLYIDAEEHELGDLDEPANYKAALLDPESKKWLDAMNVEIQSIKYNDVWVLVELPPNTRTVGSKWLFKKKTDMDGVIYVFKARLVAMRFTQTYGVDYEETFSPVADIRAIRILIAIAAYYDYEIWQMDVRTVFLNGHLSEEVYMEQLEGDAAYIFGIKIYRDRSKRLIGLCQKAYIEKILKRYHMENSKRGTIPMQEKLKLSKSHGASTPAEKQRMQNIPYASANPGEEHWTAVKNIIKYPHNTKDMFMNGYVFVLNGGVIDWKSTKQSIFATSSIDAEYIAAFDASKKAVWIRKFISGLGVVSTIEKPISMCCDNSGDITIAKDDGVTKGARHFRAKVHYFRKTIKLSDVKIEKIDTNDNLADPFTKALAFPKHSELTRNIRLLLASSFIQGATYLVTFTNDFSRYGNVYLLKHKHEVFETFKVFQKEVENQLGKTIKSLRSDRRGKYMSQEFLGHLKEHGIIAHRTPPYTPQNNGVSKRRNRTLLDMVRSMMSQTTLPNSFWDYALETAVRILNMVPTKKVDKTPYEIWHGKTPKVSYLIVWGCEAFIKRDAFTKPEKIDPRSFKCIFVGYPKETTRYSFYSLSKNKVFVAQNAEFFEYKLLDLKASGSVEDLELIQKEDTNPHVDTSLNHEADDQEIDEPRSDINPIRKSSMTRLTPDRMCLYIDDEEHELGDLGEPATYKAALLDPESKKWLDAMNVEMQSMKDNDIWVLVELSPNTRTVGSKWLFKKKTDMDAYIEKILKRYYMENSKRGTIPLQEKLKLSKSHGASTPAEKQRTQNIPYASAVGSIMYAMRCTRPDVAFAQNMTNCFQQNPGEEHWNVVKNILKYLRNTKDMFSNGYVFVLNGGVVDWKSTKQSIFATSSTYAEYIAAFDASKKAVWIRKFIFGLGIVPTIEKPISMYCDNSGAIAIAKDDGVTKGARYFCAKVHYFCETIKLGDVKIEKIDTDDNLAHPFTMDLAFPKHSELTRNIGLLLASSFM
nr:transposase, MuDR, MULE transposase domain protein [Tanacetum cinerariifolium]